MVFALLGYCCNYFCTHTFFPPQALILFGRRHCPSPFTWQRWFWWGSLSGITTQLEGTLLVSELLPSVAWCQVSSISIYSVCFIISSCFMAFVCWSMIYLVFAMTGYRHVYLEGLTEASIFVHVSVHDVYGKVRAVLSVFVFISFHMYIFIHQAYTVMHAILLKSFVLLVEPSSPESQLYHNALSWI